MDTTGADFSVPETKNKFWEMQPVRQFKESYCDHNQGPIEPPTPLSEINPVPYSLPSPFEWATCDISDPSDSSDVHRLLSSNYVEDEENMFRFNYSREFLQWALLPPGHIKSWHIGVRVKSTKKLVAFIAGVPVKIHLRQQDPVITMAEINYLCIHKKLRSKRLAPVMIKEITRRVHLENIWQAVYTAGALLPAPIATCRYWHRPLNPKKLIDVGFSEVGPRMTMSRTIHLYRLPETTATPGFRRMERRDVLAVTKLLREYLQGHDQFAVAPEFGEDDVEHLLLPLENVVECYVVESAVTQEITDFCSFFMLSSSILDASSISKYGSELKTAYSYFNVSTKTPLVQLMKDAIIMAKQMGFDVFNALDVMENSHELLRELKFGRGLGTLHYYLYNYRIGGGGNLSPSQIGLVLV